MIYNVKCAYASSIAKQFLFENRIIFTPHSHPNTCHHSKGTLKYFEECFYFFMIFLESAVGGNGKNGNR